MRILVLGGTSFIGRHLVEAAVSNGHDVTLFHRGRTGADLFPDVDRRLGDRTTGDYASLSTGLWDACIDVTAYLPRHVDEVVAALGERVGHTVVVSSVSAYDPSIATIDEDSPLHADLPSVGGPANRGRPTETVDDNTYGPLKAMVERRYLELRGADAVAIVRPTYVVGPHDPTERFTWWVRAAASGDVVGVPHPDLPVQIIDVRDLAAFLLRLATGGVSGAFDGVGDWRTALEFVRALVPQGVATVVQASAEPLQGQPLLLEDAGESALMSRPGILARAAGLTTRSLQESGADTLAWDARRQR